MDIQQDASHFSPEGHGAPLDMFSTAPTAGERLTIGLTDDEASEWEVLRVDEEAGMVYLVRIDKAEALKQEHVEMGLNEDGSA